MNRPVTLRPAYKTLLFGTSHQHVDSSYNNKFLRDTSYGLGDMRANSEHAECHHQVAENLLFLSNQLNLLQSSPAEVEKLREHPQGKNGARATANRLVARSSAFTNIIKTSSAPQQMLSAPLLAYVSSTSSATGCWSLSLQRH